MLTAVMIDTEALDQLNDIGLLEEAAQGNRRAFEILFRRHYPSVRRIVASVLGPTDEVEDVVQNVFLRVYRTDANFAGRSKFTSWLYRVAVNMTYDHLRRNKRRSRLIEHWLEKRPEPDTVSTPLERNLGKEELEKVFEALDKVKYKKRIVFILFEVEGLTLEEIGRTLGLATTTVWSRLYQARKDFKKQYDRLQ